MAQARGHSVGSTKTWRARHAQGSSRHEQQGVIAERILGNDHDLSTAFAACCRVYVAPRDGPSPGSSADDPRRGQNTPTKRATTQLRSPNSIPILHMFNSRATSCRRVICLRAGPGAELQQVINCTRESVKRNHNLSDSSQNMPSQVCSFNTQVVVVLHLRTPDHYKNDCCRNRPPERYFGSCSGGKVSCSATLKQSVGKCLAVASA